ncbi:T-cell surface glycoprotein CD3 delta chain [Coregonus clupeaformis]|uniref:T-cell surface glycoprotein CD3 delta chain n=1 Tax=Coregonus clupeaformis TaxID=59861 RepID=UPI001BE0B3C0|nr:T-cell surface glycoprotein CD3 delta chain [Coregonus clupeaformis]
MKGTILLAHLLVIWTMTVPIDSEKAQLKIDVVESSDKITLTCANGVFSNNEKSLELQYKDENTGEYVCNITGVMHNIFVKFRTCDNCIELDVAAAVAMVMGELVATVLIGVAVYCIASQPKATMTTGKKTSSKMGLIQNEASANLDPIGHYQPLNKRRMDKSEYSTLPERR